MAQAVGKKAQYTFAMQAEGCAILVGALLSGIIGAIMWSAASQRKQTEERQRLHDAQEYARATELAALFERVDVESRDPVERRRLEEIPKSAPVRYYPALTASGGWFDRAAPHLLASLQSGVNSRLAEHFFSLFAFPSGHQAKALEFLLQVMKNARGDEAGVATFQRIAGHVLSRSDVAEAQWLYDRALEQVRQREGDATSKAIALYVGRRAYSAARPDRTPTLYDEQAIANDISARVV